MHFLAQVNAPSAWPREFSGLGYGHVGKSPLGSRCSGTTVIAVMPARSSTVVTGNQARAIERRVHEFQGSFGDLLGGKVAHRFGQNRIVIALEHRVVDPFHHARKPQPHRSPSFSPRERIGVRDRSRNGLRSPLGNLAAIGAIGLITAVGGRMAGCRHANATEQLRSRTANESVGTGEIFDTRAPMPLAAHRGRHLYEQLPLLRESRAIANAWFLEIAFR